MVAQDCDFYTKMFRFARALGLDALAAKRYADIVFDYWYLEDKTYRINII